MAYNFDKIIHRNNTNSVKYDLNKQVFGASELMPMWVADMDFATPDFIRDAIVERANHPVYGYTFRGKEFNQSIVQWMTKRHTWDIKEKWISFCPGIVPALNLAVLSFTQPDDEIIVQPPVYFPFFSAVKDHGRTLVYNQLCENNGRYNIDFNDLEKKAKTAKMLLFCHPHNPVGRVWTKKELQQLIDICHRNKVIIISDEIHADLILGKHKHIPLLSLKDTENIVLSCYAPSKTFNLAGLATSYLITPDKELKKKFDDQINKLHLGMGNIFGTTALVAAYENGEDWLDQLLDYLEDNFNTLESFFKEKLPRIRVIPTEATYLTWLDFRDYELSSDELKQGVIKKAGLGLNDGPMFGPGGEGFQRINIALSRAKLLDALDRLVIGFA